MDCHLNCHGELNAIIASLPVLAYALAALRARCRTCRQKRSQ